MTESMKKHEGTWVLTKSIYIYFLTWGFGNYRKIISHSVNFLPELEIKASFSKFSVFCKRV